MNRKPTSPNCGLLHRDGWYLAPEGAAVHAETRTAVIADVHLGYEWARGAGGDCIPAHSLAETQARLARLLGRVAISRVIVAGDLVESPKPCARTREDVELLTDWLNEREVSLVVLAGNHDPRQTPALAETLDVGGWTIAHGHRPISSPRTITGHHHPKLRAGSVNVPCFLAGPSRIVLPAFSANAAGWNVASGRVPEGWDPRSLRCVASAGDEVLDFGPVAELARKLKGV